MSITPIAAISSGEELMSRVGAFSGSNKEKMRSFLMLPMRRLATLDINCSERRMSRRGVMRHRWKGSSVGDPRSLAYDYRWSLQSPIYAETLEAALSMETSNPSDWSCRTKRLA
jgi:hypothetical protein